MLEHRIQVDAPSLSRLEQASFRYATAAVLSDHCREVGDVRVSASCHLHDGAEVFDCAVEVTLATGDVLSVWTSHDDLFDALEVCLRSLGHEVRAKLLDRRTALAHVA